MNKIMSDAVEYVEKLEKYVSASKEVDEANHKLIKALDAQIEVLEQRINDLIVENTLLKAVLKKAGESE